MGLESLIVILIVGAVAGWLAGLIVRGHGHGLLANVVVGVVGAFVASMVLPAIGLRVGGGSVVASILHATVGAVILLVLLRLVRRL